MSNTDLPRTVVIIGAGAAGLEAANVLLEHETYSSGTLKVMMLEARDRVGGRIFVDRKWGVPYDHGNLVSCRQLMSGPNWIHGTIDNPLVPLASATGTRLTFPDESSQIVFTSSGEPLPPETSLILNNQIWTYVNEAIELSEDPTSTIPPDRSMYDYCAARIEADEYLDDDMKPIALQLLGLLTIFTAVDVRKQSLRHYEVEAELPVRSSPLND
jgi:phytoene dehydrogenase-like protein